MGLAAKLRLLTPEPATPEPTTGEDSMIDPPIPDERLELVPTAELTVEEEAKRR